MKDEIKVKDPNILIQLLLALLILPFNGWVIKLMWGWFIVPLGVMPVTLWHAIGLDVIISCFRATISSKKIDGGFWARMFTALFLKLYFLFISFVIHLFM